MSEFMLEPEEIEPERPERYTPPRMVATGLAPTAELPRSARKGKERAASYEPCPTCQTLLLYGVTDQGVRLALDVKRLCYVVDWDKGEDTPRLLVSRAYVVHEDCGGTPPVQVQYDKELHI